ncbi:hypothetical protein POTOM_014875 [Populus tomentosa]|uniref:Uncharacterized protein n=1 Tax=Populus tomentosa TaxID=118781 RepID=A0A8X7ZWQ8_POPTO|nr:hypothetical protein POTOM_014875 [Populus tomentosa]
MVRRLLWQVGLRRKEKGNWGGVVIGRVRRKSGSGWNVEDGNEQEKESGVRKVALDVDDDEDAICKRTRAKYSLASFTLDELETFLQESDDEDDLPNVDDEVECRKFLLRLFCLSEMVMGLIFEMLHKRDDVIACKSVPYPGICFRPPYICSSVSEEMHNIGQHSAPLTVWEYRQRFLNSSSETWNEKEPLFYFPRFPLLGEANGEVMRGNIHPAANTVPSSPGQQPPKKTLAASIVESTKKQSIALVPKNISKLAQRLVPLFNPALFPHKPPPAAVANRVLFTDS